MPSSKTRSWRKIPILYQKAASPPATRTSWSLHAERARVIHQLLSVIGSQLDPIERCAIAAKSSRRRATAALLHPTSAELHARLAEASAEISMSGTPSPRPRKPCGSTGSPASRQETARSRSAAGSRPSIPKWTESAAKMPVQPAP